MTVRVFMLDDHEGLAAADAFYVSKKGAAFATDGAISVSTKTLTSAANPFSVNDVNKTIIVAGAGPAGADLVTTIAVYNSAGSVDLSAAAGTTVSGADVFVVEPRRISADDLRKFTTRAAALSADPANPGNGEFVLWLSDGTGSGDDGDLMLKITDTLGTTKTITLVDFSVS